MDAGYLRMGVAVAVLAALVFGPRFFFADRDSAPPDSALLDAKTVPAPMVYRGREPPPNRDVDLEHLGPEPSALLAAEDYGGLNDYLLGEAARAVEHNDRAALGGALSLLGQLALEEQDFDSAELYLLEALDVYSAAGDTPAVAQVNMHLGRMHVKLRERARVAGHAYDRLLLARWQINAGHDEAAKRNLRLVIDENLSIHRYGAAASAYASLADLHQETGDLEGAEGAAAEAAELYAASGQLAAAEAVLRELGSAGISTLRLAELKFDMRKRFEEFEMSTAQIERAKDFDRLYSHLQSRGELEDAWRLRRKARSSLQKVSRRAMYRRMPDVLALLYVSNHDMERAHRYFDLASESFETIGRDDLAVRTELLRDEIY